MNAPQMETRPGAQPGETVCEGCIHGPACRVIPCATCSAAWHLLGMIDNPFVCPRCEDGAGMLTATCDGCGVTLADDNTACVECDRCNDCMPGNCFECRELRRESESDKAWRYAIENEVCS